METDKKLLKVSEVASRFGVTKKTVTRWIREGKLPAIVTPGGKHYRVDEKSVQKLKEEGG